MNRITHPILRHFRIPNLLIMGLLVFLLHLQFKSWLTAPLDSLSILLLIFSMWLVAAAGYLLNDYYDFREDLINKGYAISSRFSHAYIIRLYSVLTVSGLGISTYISFSLQRYGILFCSFLATVFLFLYAYQFKRLYYIKNLWISLLMTFPVIYWYLADAYGNESLTQYENYIFLLTGYLLLFSFLLNLIREILKDIYDAPGDREAGVKTIPLVFGLKLTWRILIFLFLLTGIIMLVFIELFKKYNTAFTLAQILIFAMLSLVFIFFFLQKKDVNKTSFLLKIIMLSGIFSLFFIHGQS